MILRTLSVIGASLIIFIAWQHRLECQAVERFRNRWAHNRRLYISNEKAEEGMHPSTKRSKWWKNYREKCGELGPGACYLTPHDFGHWRGRLYAMWDIKSTSFMIKHGDIWWGCFKVKMFFHSLRYKMVTENHRMYEKDRLLFWRKQQ